MKIILVVSGSRGDVQPLIALAIGLKARGHEALLCAPPENEELATLHDCPFLPFGNSIKTFSEEIPEPAFHPIKATLALTELLKKETVTQFRELPSIAKGADLILGATFIFGVRSVAQALNIPYAMMTYCPQVFPSAEYPHVLITNHKRSKYFNIFSWWLFSKIGNLSFLPLINRERKKLKLPPINDVWHHILGDHPILASDEELGKVPKDAGVRVSQVGHLALEQKDELDSNLLSFLKKGPPPVYIGFGSMKSEDPKAITELVLEAGKSSGQRLLLAPGWGNLSSFPNSDKYYFSDPVPHSKLFPRAAAVVHHGGAGTVATAARAGIPQVIIPHMMDQFYWAHRIERLGLGPEALFKSRLTPSKLTHAISEAVSLESFRKQCTHLAAKLNSRNALPSLIDLLGEKIDSFDPDNDSNEQKIDFY